MNSLFQLKRPCSTGNSDYPRVRTKEGNTSGSPRSYIDDSWLRVVK